MSVNNLEIENQNKLDIENNVEIEKEQNKFLETTLGKVVNTGIEIGIRALLPNFIEDQIIEIKDNLFNYGIKDGLKKTVDDAISLGKSALGIFNNNFESVTQMRDAVKLGGIVDGVADLIDIGINKVSKTGKIDNNILNIIKIGKDALMDSISNGIDKKFSNEMDSIKSLENSVDEWKKAFKNKDMEKMEKAFLKIQNDSIGIAPIKKVLEETSVVENLHNLIKNNGNNFDLTDEELKLAGQLS